MRRSIYFIGIMCMMFTSFGVMPLQAQDSKQYAVFNYRNDGQFNAFLNHKIDSITFSCIDTLGIEHDDVVVQEVWTPDSVYRIPLNAIDSLAFRAPKPKMRDNLFYIRDYHADYTLSTDSLTLYFKTAINSDSLPAIGQVVLSVTEKTPFEEGFAGRVKEINHSEGRIEVVCITASLCDVFERLVIAGAAVSDEDEYKAILKARHADGPDGGGGTAWDELVNEKDHIESIKGLPEEWKATILDLYTVKSKNPRVECFYSINVTLWDFYVNTDIFIHHDDLTYSLTFDWDKISKMGEKYSKFKKVWDLLRDGDLDAVRKAEAELEEKEWEEKTKIPFYVGPLNCSVEFGGMLKPEGLDVKISKEEKTSALQHIGLYVKGYTNKYSYWYDKIATAFSSESIWDALDVQRYDVDGIHTFDQDPYKSVTWDVKFSGAFTAGIFARFNVSLLTKYLIRASVGAEMGVKLEGTADFKLYDTDYEDVGNEHLDANPSASSSVYSVLKDTNIDMKAYVKFKGEAGALPFDLINLSGEKEIKIWEGKFYLMPHFTKPSLTTELSGYLRGENEKFTTTVSKDIMPLLTCYPGLGVYRYYPTSHGMTLEKIIEYTDPEPYKYIFAEDNPERDEELSIYNKGLVPGTEYYCYPIFKMFNHTFKAGPYITFTYPKPLTLENPSLILQKDVHQLVRINGGWGDYAVDCYPKDVVKAELVTSGNLSQVRLITMKAGTATVEVRDKRSLEKATLEVKVFGNPEEGTAITVSEENIDFGALAYGYSESKSFKVTNHGSKELCFSIDDSKIDGGFTVEGTNEIQYLQPGANKTFTVIAKGIGPNHVRKGMLLIASNATKEPVPITLEVKGNATSVKYVDLGLSVKWAECNLGALAAADCTGDFFAWGETECKTSYGWNNYIHCDGTAETCRSLGNISGTDNDAAHYQWGGKWRMPTSEEFKELREKCTWKWDNSLQMVGGSPGYMVTGPNGKNIFLEAAGIRKDNNLMEVNRQGFYLSSNQGESNLQTAQALFFENGKHDMSEVAREMGVCIRPVYDDNMLGLQLSITTLTLTTGQQVTVDVTSGSGSYDAVSNTKNVATVTVEGSKLVINAVAPGSATITVKDNQTQERAKIEVTVNESKSTIKVVPTEIDFGKVAVGTSKTEHFTVSNVGTSNFTFHVSEQHEIIDIPESGKEFTLAVGEEKIFEVIFTPTNPHGGYGAAVRVFSDAENGTQYIEIDGQGVEGGSEDDDAPEGVEAIDLGLPSGTKWASCNVGATKPEEYGGYYAWGETEEKEVYTRNNYKLNHASVVSNISGTQYDVAHVKWGGNWVMPTYEQQQELVDNCTSEWITLNGVNGRKITGPNGNSIFLPAAGFRGGDLWYAGVEGRYRSSTQYPKNSDQAYYLGFGSNYLNWGGGYRLEGYSVRPVIHSTPTLADLTLSSTGPITVKVDDKATVEITSGNGDYTAASDNEDVAIARVYDNATVMIKGISVGTATVSVTDTKSGQTAAITVTVTGTINPDVSPAEAIDLGLPSGTKWASCNVGASKPEEYGGLYAWGETEEKDVYNESTYKYYQDGSYVNLGSDISGTDYDVAHVKWGDNWVMPTRFQQEELHDNCTYEWTTLNGVNGGKFTGPNGNSIFLPAAGSYWGGLDRTGSHGNYWSSTQRPDGSYGAYYLAFASGGAYWRSLYRYDGRSVRPVVRN